MSRVPSLRKQGCRHGPRHSPSPSGDSQRRALEDGALEEAAGAVADHEVSHGIGSCRLPEQGDRSWVTTEGFDVGCDPLNGRNLVEQPKIGRGDSW